MRVCVCVHACMYNGIEEAIDTVRTMTMILGNQAEHISFWQNGSHV